MQLVINHVTRMKPPRICVAGVDPNTHRHIRPTAYRGDKITRGLLRDEGGPFGMGAVVELGSLAASPSPPETEDHRFHTARARYLGDMPDDEFLQLLDRLDSETLADGFGAALERRGWKYAVEMGCGEHSLAVIRARRRPELEVDARYGRLQLRFNDVEPQAYVPITDIRFYRADQRTIDEQALRDVNRRIRRGVDAFLMFGLAHPFKAAQDEYERHWLQLNGLCLADRPVGDRP